MKIKLSQVKYKTANFTYNYDKISENIDNNVDLNILPSLAFDDLNFKSLAYDSNCLNLQDELFGKLADKFKDTAILVGCYLVKNSEVFDVKNNFVEINDKKIYVSDTYDEEIDCDLYVLSKNRYYAMNSFEKFSSSVVVKSDFIYVNSIGLADENVYCGQSFVKDKDNNILKVLPLLEEASIDVDFSNKNDIKTLSIEEEVFNVTTFALKEYCENTGFKNVILGLSGGIDSALVAVLAKEALGAEHVSTIMLPSMYSSKGSIDDSVELAKNLGINVEEVPITPLFKCFMENVAKEDKMDLAEENLQSRLRGLILMFYSNRYNKLLLTTGNKSEVACGYGTLYGDMCGGLNLIADLTKTKVYKLAKWLNRNGEVIPENILTKAPSAELRPNQKDQDSLPEYAKLDRIIELYVEENTPVSAIIEEFGKETVDKVLKLLYRAQFKRKQACLGVRLTEKALCANVTYPISQGLY